MVASVFYLWLTFIMVPAGLSGGIIESKILSIESHTKIHEYTTLEACEQEAERILRDMQESYPEDTTMRTYCTDTPHPREKL